MNLDLRFPNGSATAQRALARSPLTTEELKDLRIRLSKMTQYELMKFYDDALSLCRLENGAPPRAAFIQQLVAAWKVMQLIKAQKSLPRDAAECAADQKI